MKAIGYTIPGSIDLKDSLQDISLDKPTASGKDLLVKIYAVSVNPVDTKLRSTLSPEAGTWKVLGFDAAGIVEEVGPDVIAFKPGDEVFYAGDFTRVGTNSEYHLVDERIVGLKPKTLSFAEAAALPLTAITAWEMLFERLKVLQPTAQGEKSILIIGGAGGVGSIAIQLLRALTDMTVIATASRSETKSWAYECGAHYVLDHSKPIAPQFIEHSLAAPGFIFSTTHTDQHWLDIVELIAPQGRFGLIDDPTAISITQLKRKAVSIHWEYMFARSLFNTPDIAEQGKILNSVSSLVNSGKVHSTLTEIAGKINAENIRIVHAKIERGIACGKIVLEGF